MSKHIGRKETWFEISNRRYNSMEGYVELNKFGTWDAVVVYKSRQPLVAVRKGQPKKEQPERPWRRATKHAGEHKRLREAMMAVENAAKKMREEGNPDRLF